MSLLRIPCPECSGHRVVAMSNSNDPSARLEPCEECLATGNARCALCMHGYVEATDAVIINGDVVPLCARHMAEEMENADVE